MGVPSTQHRLEARKESVGTKIAQEINAEMKEIEGDLVALNDLGINLHHTVKLQDVPLAEAEKTTRVAEQAIREGDLALERAEILKNSERKRSVWMIPALGAVGVVVGTAGFAISFPAGLVTMAVLGVTGAGGGAFAALKS